MNNRRSNYFSMLRLTQIILILLYTVMLSAQNKKHPKENMFIVSSIKSVFLNVDINDASAAIKVWGNRLQKIYDIPTKFDLVIFEDIQELLKSPDVDNHGLIILNPIDYLEYKSRIELHPSLIPIEKVEYVVLVKNKDISFIKDLKGKRICLFKLSNNPLPGMWIDVLLGRNKLGSKESFFSSIVEMDSESQILMSVFFDKNDIAVVSKSAFETMVELNPQIGRQLKSIVTSPEFIIGISCFSKNSNKFSYRDKFLAAAQSMDQHPEGKQTMTLMKTAKIKLYTEGCLNTVIDLYNEYKSLKKNRRK